MGITNEHKDFDFWRKVEEKGKIRLGGLTAGWLIVSMVSTFGGLSSLIIHAQTIKNLFANYQATGTILEIAATLILATALALSCKKIYQTLLIKK